MKIRFRHVLLTLLILFVGFVVYRLTSGDVARPGVPLFTPTVAANHVTEPVDENGDVDYTAILNERASNGISPENNLVAGLIGIGGDRFIEDSDHLSDVFYSRLGIDRPKSGETFWWKDWVAENLDEPEDIASLEPFIDLWDQANSMEWFASVHPWTKEELPNFAKYLSETSRERDQVKELLESVSGNYVPIAAITDSDSIFANYRTHDAIILLSRLFRTTCNGKLSEGDFKGAIGEYRYLVLIANADAQKPSQMDRLFARTLRSTAIEQAWGIVRNQRCPADQLIRLQGMLEKLEEPTPFLESLETERLTMLYTTQNEIRYGTGVIDTHAFGGVPIEGRAGRSNVIYDSQILMTRINEYYDSIISRLQGLDSVDRISVLESIESETGNAEPDRLLLEPNYYLAKMQGQSARSHALADAYIRFLAPSSSAARFEVDVAAKRKMLSLAIAIELYQREHGSYPESLDPAALDLPSVAFVDPCNGDSFIYRLNESSFELYSTGIDAVDDNGQSEDVYPLEASDDVMFEDLKPMTWKEHAAEEAKALIEYDSQYE